MCNDNRGAFMHDDAAFGGVPLQRSRAVIADTRGDRRGTGGKGDRSGGACRPPVATEDRAPAGFSARVAALDAELFIAGVRARRGTRSRRGAGWKRAESHPPLDLRQLLTANSGGDRCSSASGSPQAATMLQPVGGMGQIGAAFGRKLART